MKLNRAKGDIAELYKLVNSWSGTTATSLEDRSLALSMVKSIYESIRFDGEDDKDDEDDVVAVNNIEAVIEVAEKIEERIEPEVEVESEVESEPEVEAEPEVESEPEVEVIAEVAEPNCACGESVTCNEINENKSVQESGERSDEERRERRRHIKSLYGDEVDQPVARAVVEQSRPTEIKEQERVCYAEPETPAAPVVERQSQPSPYGLPSLGSLLTLNDRFLLSNDLFDGNMVMLNSALIALDEQQTLDDSLLYIAENYRWSGDSDGAQLLNALLKSRFNN